jgi:hypothetical protein
VRFTSPVLVKGWPKTWAVAMVIRSMHTISRSVASKSSKVHDTFPTCDTGGSDGEAIDASNEA